MASRRGSVLHYAVPGGWTTVAIVTLVAIAALFLLGHPFDVSATFPVGFATWHHAQFVDNPTYFIGKIGDDWALVWNRTSRVWWIGGLIVIFVPLIFYFGANLLGYVLSALRGGTREWRWGAGRILSLLVFTSSLLWILITRLALFEYGDYWVLDQHTDALLHGNRKICRLSDLRDFEWAAGWGRYNSSHYFVYAVTLGNERIRINALTAFGYPEAISIVRFLNEYRSL